MNVYDSQRMADLVAREGYGEATGVDDADLIILNTCYIRERAAEKIFSELGKLRELKEGRQNLGRETTLVVAGCVAQAEGAEILRRQPAVDVVVGPQSYHRLPGLLRESRVRSGVVDVRIRSDPDWTGRWRNGASDGTSRYAAMRSSLMSRGCDVV